jgi:hypothetical protein
VISIINTLLIGRLLLKEKSEEECLGELNENWRRRIKKELIQLSGD